ncbi:GumC family protein [Candidatus Omnitrophota bacterium]
MLGINAIFSRVLARPKIIIISTAAALTLGLILLIIIPRNYVAIARLEVNVGDHDNVVGSLNSVASELKDRSIIEEVVKKLNLKNAFGKRDAVEVIFASLNTRAVPEEDVVEVNVRAKKAEVAAQVANTLCNIYINMTAGGETASEEEKISNFQKKVTGLRKDLEESIRKMRELGRSLGIADLKVEYETTKEKAATLQAGISIIRTERQEAQIVYDDIQKLLSSGIKPEELDLVKNDESYKRLGLERSAIQTGVDNLLKKYKKDHPDVLKMSERLSAIEKLIGDRSQVIVDGVRQKHELAKSKEESARKIIEEENERLSILEKQLDEYNSLVNEAKEKEAVYKTLLKKVDNEIGLESQSQHAKLLEQAYLPESKEGMPPQKIIFLSLLIGFGLGAGYNIYTSQSPVVAGRQSSESAKPKNKVMYIERVKDDN